MRLALALSCSLALGGCYDLDEQTIEYDPRFGSSTSMDVYSPTDGKTMRPAVMLVHGGAWKLFHKERYTVAARRFARAGYVAISVEYRLVPEGVFPNAAHDVACALAYLQNHAAELGVDPARIVTVGYSAGAHLTGLIATGNTHPTLAPTCAEGVPDKPAGEVSAAGPMDMLGLAQVGVVEDFLGGSAFAHQATYIVASPISHVTADDPPFLFIHGSHDLAVPIEQSYAMRDELRRVGVEADVLEIRGSGHIINSSEDPGEYDVATILDSPEAWIAVDHFLARVIGRP